MSIDSIEPARARKPNTKQNNHAYWEAADPINTSYLMYVLVSLKSLCQRMLEFLN